MAWKDRKLTIEVLGRRMAHVEPGAILIGAQREFCRAWPDQTEVTVAGSGFVQEDSRSEIGRVIADWLPRIR